MRRRDLRSTLILRAGVVAAHISLKKLYGPLESYGQSLRVVRSHLQIFSNFPYRIYRDNQNAIFHRIRRPLCNVPPLHGPVLLASERKGQSKEVLEGKEGVGRVST